MKFNERLRFLRVSNDLTQSELAEKLGISLSMIKKLEAGERETSFEKLIELSKFFNCTVDHLLGNDVVNSNTIIDASYPPWITGYKDGQPVIVPQKDFSCPAVTFGSPVDYLYKVDSSDIRDFEIALGDIALIKNIEKSTPDNDAVLYLSLSGKLNIRIISRESEFNVFSSTISRVKPEIIPVDKTVIIGLLVGVIKSINRD